MAEREHTHTSCALEMTRKREMFLQMFIFVSVFIFYFLCFKGKTSRGPKMEKGNHIGKCKTVDLGLGTIGNFPFSLFFINS